MKNQVCDGIFKITNLQPHQSPFSKGFVYKGTFYTADGAVPCSAYSHGPQASLHLSSNEYFVQGPLDRRGSCQYIIKPKTWVPREKRWNFAAWRYQAKESYRHFISKKCSNHPRAAQFLASLTTGDVEDRLLKFEFGRLGLQHLLAISGFHFGILIAFVSMALSLFLPRFWKIALLILSLTVYYFFVGPFPAVQRSWLTAIAYLTGKLIRRETTGLNLLGIAMGFELAVNPLIASNLGFQFSFASCAGILFFYPCFEKKLLSIFPKRSNDAKSALSLMEKHVYLLTSFFRKSIALNMAVNTALLPLLLFHFHAFPLLSLLYNLFFPFCVGIALCGLLSALCFHLLVPSLGSFLFSATSWFTAKLLDLAAYPPTALDYPILISGFPSWALPFCLFTLMFLSIRRYSCQRRQSEL